MSRIGGISRRILISSEASENTSLESFPSIRVLSMRSMSTRMSRNCLFSISRETRPSICLVAMPLNRAAHILFEGISAAALTVILRRMASANPTKIITVRIVAIKAARRSGSGCKSKIIEAEIFPVSCSPLAPRYSNRISLSFILQFVRLF